MGLGTTYLDHAGTTPFPRSLIKNFKKEMNSNIFGNPHSHSPSSMLSTDVIESTRIRALKLFNADPEHFDLLFVANATAAIKLVAHCIADHSREDGGFWYGYHADAHTSLVGVRQIAAPKPRCFQNDQAVEDWFTSLRTDSPASFPEKEQGIGLFAYPGQSNMNGRRLPLHWSGTLRSLSKRKDRKIYSLLDAAALVATAPLDLSDHEHAPDFTALSFYKIFGFPDLGALIVRKAAAHALCHRRYFGGGTVDMVINGDIGPDVMGDWYAKKASSLHEMLEDGTPAFHSIAALKVALSVYRQLFGSMLNVTRHTSALAKTLFEEMSTMLHTNGTPVCTIYKSPSSTYGDGKTQGPTIAFNLRDSKGDWIGKSDFETLAIANNIQIRTGGLCNPGGIAHYLGISAAQMRENFEEGVRCGNEIDEMHGLPTGVIRISLGAMSSEKDISTFLRFLGMFVDKSDGASQDALSFKSHHAKLETVQSIQETTASPICPIAACRESFETRLELTDHLLAHKIKVQRRWWRCSR